MYRTTSPGTVGSLPTPASASTAPGYFAAGETIPQTYLSNDWANMIQEELMSFLTDAGIDPSAGTYNQVLSSVQALKNPSNINVYQIISGTQKVSVNGAAFTATGATSFTAPSGAVKVRIWGGGGAAGGSSGSNSIAGSGGGGEYVESILTGLSGSYTITVGAGGTAGNNTGPTDGTNGGTSSFGTILTCVGGHAGSAESGSGFGTAGGGGSGGTGIGFRVPGISASTGYQISTTNIGSIPGGSFGVSLGVPEVAGGAGGAGALGLFPGGGGGGSIGAGGASGAGASGCIIIEW